MFETFRDVIARLASGGGPLTAAEMRSAVSFMLNAEATPAQMGAFLMGLKIRGETVEEIAAAAEVLREKAVPVDAPADAIDTCGTGGDGAGTYNISTAVALVVAACGAPVAKHGNRALSSKSGSSEVLQALGVNVDAAPDVIARCIREAGIGFMFAPAHHGAMRHVAPVRGELGVRTLFNLIGPLANPAGARRQLLGVYDTSLVEPLAHVLKALGSVKAWVVHGSDGLDELTVTGPSAVAELAQGAVRSFETTPEDAGLKRWPLSDIVGGSPEDNAAALQRLLGGELGPYRDIVALNAGAALCVADKAHSLRYGVELAAKAIDSGAAKTVLDTLVRISNI